MANAYFVTVDARHFRIFQETKDVMQRVPSLLLVETLDLMTGRSKYFTGRETDMAGRFPTDRGVGGSIDERLPMQEEQERRIADQIAERINAFFARRPDASWHFAAGPGLHQDVLVRLDADVLRRMRQAVQKELANLPAPELMAHFAQR